MYSRHSRPWLAAMATVMAVGAWSSMAGAQQDPVYPPMEALDSAESVAAVPPPPVPEAAVETPASRQLAQAPGRYPPAGYAPAGPVPPQPVAGRYPPPGYVPGGVAVPPAPPVAGAYGPRPMGPAPYAPGGYGPRPYGPGPYGGYRNGPWGGNGMDRWFGGRDFFGGGRGPFGRGGPGRWFGGGDPEDSMAEMWEDMINAPADMGEMPGGWQFPEVGMPNPVDVQKEFRDAAPEAAREVPHMFRWND